MLRHLFHLIDQVLRPKKEANTNIKYPISLNNLGQGDGTWSTRNKVIRWDLDTIAHLFRLPSRRQEKVAAALAAIPQEALTNSLRKWRKLLGML